MRNNRGRRPESGGDTNGPFEGSRVGSEAGIASRPPGGTGVRAPVLALVLLCAAQFMVILDVTVVNVALPSIQASVGIAFADLQWVVTAYTLAFGGLLLLGGRAADLLGRRRVFLTGLAVFTAASLAAGLTSSQQALLAARALQGVGAALLSPAALSLITVIFPEGHERRRALAAWGAVGASGAALGVLVGGALTEAFGWGAVFLINAPVGVTVAAAALRVLPATRLEVAGRIDATGALTVTASLVALIYALVGADGAGWASAQTLGLLGVAAAGFGVFVVAEARAREPLVPLTVFRQRPVVIALVLMMLGMGTLVSGFFFSSQYLQHVLGHSPVRTGLEFLPVAAAIVVTAHAAGHLIARLGAKPVIAGGLALSAAGTFLLGRLPADGDYQTDVLPGFLLLSLGSGLIAVAVTITAMTGAEPQETGLRSGLTTTAHELGIAFVLSLLTAVAATRIGGGALETAGIPGGGGDLTAGLAVAFQVATMIALAALLVTLVGLRRGDVPPGSTPSFIGH
jgi:EmrB/QacA subfamily drug resistance transporter